MQEMTGAGATKTKLVNSMLESVGSLGIQSRSSAMLNQIDPKQAQEQIQAVRKTLQEYAKQEAQLAQLITHRHRQRRRDCVAAAGAGSCPKSQARD